MNVAGYEAYQPEAPPIQSTLGGMFAMSEPDDADEIFDLPEEAPQSAAMVADDVIDDSEILIAPEAEDAPETGLVELRTYQQAALDATLAEFRQKITGTLNVMATGTGKSVILASLAKWANDKGHGVLILVHRDELIRQLVKSCSRCGVVAGVEKAGEKARGGYPHFWPTVVASVQTLRGKRLEEWPRDSFKLVIVDEAHHCLRGNSYGAVLQHFGLDDGRIRLAGFTATADRLDGQNVGQVFESLAYEYNIRNATRDGWLVPIEALQLKTEPPIDLRDLRILAGDFNKGDLERAINDNIGILVNALADTQALEDRRTIAFTPNIGSAKALADALCDVGIKSRGVAGNDPDRHAVFEGHRRGDFQVLVNCMIATEGYDDPQVSAILIARPTKSRALYSQMVGRGTRLFDGKTNCRIVDFAFLTGQHQLVSPVDLYDNSETADEVVSRARDLMAEGQFNGIEEALEAAQEEYENERRIRIARRMVSVQATKFDPLSACDVYGIPQKSGYDWSDAAPATDKQRTALEKWGIHIEGFVGKGTASKLLNKIFGRAEHGWASPREIRQLIESGIEPDAALAMRSEQARDYLQHNPLGPTEKQIKMLKWKGVRDDEIAGMTRKQASERISAIMGGA